MKGEWIWRTVISVLIGLLGWFAKGSFDEQKAFNKQVDSRLNAIDLEQARATASRFTMAEWVAVKQVIDATLANQDKRITRTEDAIIVMKELLPRMEKKIDDLNHK